LWAAFQYFDQDGSGFITADEIIDALKSQNLTYNEEEIKTVFKNKELKGKKLDFQEFKKLINL
jgi:Ca2+-binding EF-hand superfamily protein